MRISLTAGSVDLLLDCPDDVSPAELEEAGLAVDGRLVEGARLGHRDPEMTTTGWQLHVVGGPDVGAVFALPDGRHEIGRGASIAFADEALSRRHCAITLTGDTAEVSDLGSTHGTRIDGVPVATPTRWRPGQLLGIGHSLVALREATAATAAVEAAEPGWLRFLRQPRLAPEPRSVREIEVPERPRPRERRGIPVIALAVPVAFAGVMVALTRQPGYAIFALMSPVMVLGNWLAERVTSRRSHRAALTSYDEELVRVERRIAAAVHAEEARLRDELPDAAATFVTCVLPGRRLWERRPEDDDALTLRIGTATRPAGLKLVGREAPLAADVPVGLSLRECPVIGVAGPSTGLLRWLVVQLAAYHPPRDLGVTLLTADTQQHWSWVRWLPHLRRGDGAVAIGHDPDTVAAQVARLTAIMTARRADPDRNHAAQVVVIDGHHALRATPGLARLLTHGPAVAIYAICADEAERLLPESCTATVLVEEATLRRSGRPDVGGVIVEAVNVPWCDRVARSIAPLRDVPAGDASGRLPATARLRPLLGQSPGEAVLGVGVDGPMSIDLSRDGPHLLIAGTTGSGKSELLQTLIAALATTNSPEQLTFVLVDYKGDSAFGECARLPHCVGKVTDLDPHLVERALRSLAAELRHRERVLAKAGAKDLEDYQRRPDLPALPRLVLVIDEFAALVRDLPDFVSGLVSIAQRGRSLGLHLVLATQRPSGVLSPEIRANTNLRIALRVADAADSVDVIGTPDAARIDTSTPGRGYLTAGPHRPRPFQTARVGARRSGTTGRFVCATPAGWADLGRTPPRPKDEGAPDAGDTDLARLVDELVATHGAEPRRPWLPPLPERLLREPQGDGDVLEFGVCDLPDEQAQRPAVLDLAKDGHLLVIGSAGSGRSQVLRVLAAAVARHSPDDLHLHAIDCGNGALRPLTELPHTGVVAHGGESDRVTRLLARLEEEMDGRQAALARTGAADLAELRRTGTRLPRLVVMVDRFEAFLPTFGEVDDGAPMRRLTRILREGASLGLHLVITGDRSLAAHRIASLTDHKLLLRLADKADAVLLGLSPRAIPDRMSPGRGFLRGVETQVSLLDEDASGRGQAAALGALVGAPARLRRPLRLDPLPAWVGLSEALALRAEDGPGAIVGVGGDELTAYVAPHPSFVIAGPPRSGRSAVLVGAARSALASGADVVAVAPRPSPVRQLDGLAGVITDPAAVEPEYLDLITPAARDRAGARPVVLVIDDAEELRDAPVAALLSAIIRGGLPGVSLLAAGEVDALACSLSGWTCELRRARRGLLLSPQTITDGDLIGLRVPRGEAARGVRPGRGLLHLGDGMLRRVATLGP